MILLGVLLIVLGFGSMILDPMNLDFLSWADDVQPALGLIVGLLGVVLVVSGLALNKKRARASAQKPGVGEWVGDGRWAGSSPSAPLTSGPLTGERASGGLAHDVEPTEMGAMPHGARDSAVATNSAADEPDTHHPSRSDVDDLYDVHGGQPVVPDRTGAEAAGGRNAHPDKDKWSRPHGGRQQAGRPGTPSPEKARPRPEGSSYGDAVDQGR